MLLNCHSYFSLRYGTISPARLIELAKAESLDQIAITDMNSTSAILESLRIGQEAGIHVVPGVDFRNGTDCCYIALARNNEGLKEINDHLSRHLHSGKSFEQRAPEFENVFVIYPLRKWNAGDLLRTYEFLGVSTNDLALLARLQEKLPGGKLVYMQAVSFENKQQFNVHRLLRSIDQNCLLSKLDPRQQGSEDELFQSREKIEEGFAEYPALLKRSEELLKACEVKFEFNKLANLNLRTYTGTEEGDMELLRVEALKGLKYRYINITSEITDRVEKELTVIRKMRFASYFLINWDITRYARSRNYFYVGRGSGANSMVAYLLRITDVDPIDLDLYFERFINEHRSNAPDFDIDFSWTDRDDITNYIFTRFGKERTALLGTYSTFQHDAVIRELGKVFGLPTGEIEKLQRSRYADDNDKLGKLVLKYSALVQGFPSHLSIHASGIIISEEPVHNYTATFMPPKGLPTTQFSMLEAEDIGLFKFDILSQRGLGKIKDAVGLIKSNRGIEIDIHDVNRFKQDEAIKKLLKVGDCIGCFYVESPSMRMLLAKLQADDYLRLVAASSIIRPGVSKSGMMREYILRYRQPALREAAMKKLPELYRLLAETYGVMVYQEDVIKIAHFFADLSLAEADYLRRGMSWKFKQRNEFWKVKEKFFSNCRAKGHAENAIKDIWDQIESFANFAFSKGHSASYAVESYQALYLKAHFPIEYMVATLNNGGGFYRKEIYLQEARKNGATVHLPCINKSQALCTLEGTGIYLGLVFIAGIEENMIDRILRCRQKDGLFQGLEDFVERTSCTIEQLRLLVRAGCFSFTGRNKRALLWEAHMLVNPHHSQETSGNLFQLTPKKYELPKLENTWYDEAMDQVELLGFPLCSPFGLLKEKPTSQLCARELPSLVGQRIEIHGYLVHQKSTSTSRGDKMVFGTFLDQEGNWLDTVHFPPSLKMFPFSGPGCYKVTGKVCEEFDYFFLEADSLKRLANLNRDETSDAPPARGYTAVRHFAGQT